MEYDGSDFHGWQKQVNTRTVQGELEKAVNIITREDITVTGSGRTDAGVHALAQTAHFICRSRLSASEMQNALNSLTAKDVTIHSCQITDPDFHARFSAKKKTYRYHILNSALPSPIKSRYSWHLAKPLDLEAMIQAVQLIKGKKDFKSFEATGSPRNTTIRTISKADFTVIDEMITFDIEADGFLRYMVRNIMGTLVEVGLNKISALQVEKILNAYNRKLAGATAPAKGLFLIKVDY